MLNYRACWFFLFLVILGSCNKPKEHIAPAVSEADSLGLMISYGVNMLVSDSGVMKYRLVTERWIMNDTLSTFDKGVFFTEFDKDFHIKAYVQADTAYRYEQQHLIELRGRVRVRTKDGLVYRSEQLYWDQNEHELYSYVYSFLQTPERTIEGHYFRSNEQMTKYYVSNSKGIFNQSDMGGGDESSNGSKGSSGSSQNSGGKAGASGSVMRGAKAVPDSVMPVKRQPITPYRKR